MLVELRHHHHLLHLPYNNDFILIVLSVVRQFVSRLSWIDGGFFGRHITLEYSNVLVAFASSLENHNKQLFQCRLMRIRVLGLDKALRQGCGSR